jgi:NAD(P)-dependent dehydrogenase (short-subunit alcohol dehydrogenase family)
MDRLKDRVCIVTGAGSPGDDVGNGRAAAIQFAREGAHVVVNDLDEGAALRTLEWIEAEGGSGSICVGDLSRADEAERLVDHAVSTWGRLDVVHNNIGISGRGTVVDASEELWDRVMTVNVKTIMLMGKFAVPALARTGGGSIVNVSSLAAIRPSGRSPYSASKGAVIALSQSMAFDHAAQGIRVNCIAPGPIFTPHAGAIGMSEDVREKRRLASPLGIEGTAWDVANAAVFLASAEARFITGVVLLVDGGVALTSAARH